MGATPLKREYSAPYMSTPTHVTRGEGEGVELGSTDSESEGVH